MDDSFGPDFYTVEDEDGNTFELELIDTLEHEGIVYHAFYPAAAMEEDEEEIDIDLDDEDGLVILKVIEEEGEPILSSLDSDEEAEEIYELFMERFMEDDEE
ncbi:MAG: DUF1292 domain-containing protein [Eubacteriales bacterium]